MTQLFKVVSFERNVEQNELFVELETNNVWIPLNQFEKWLADSDRLYWEHNYSDHNGDHVQECGLYTIDQYWQMASIYILNDIYEYFIVNKFVDPFAGIKNSITKILENA